MKTRSQIWKKGERIHKKIAELKATLVELQKEDFLLSDKKQQFTESIEVIKERKDGKLVSREALVGRIRWQDKYYDEDEPAKPIIIDRTQVVRIDGNWRF